MLSRLLQTLYYLSTPKGFVSFDTREWDCWVLVTHRLQHTPDAGTTKYDAWDGQELHWEFDEECGRMYVTYPDD